MSLNTSKYCCPPGHWDDHVEEYRTMTSDSRMDPFIMRALTVADAARPFSSATAIVDVGCGTGKLISTLIREKGSLLPFDSRLLAIDYSAGMVASVAALKRSSKNTPNPLWQRLETYVLDAADLLAGGDNAPIAPGSLSHVLSNFVLLAVADYKAALRSAHTALAGGGVFAFTTPLKVPWVDCWTYARDVLPENQDWNLEVPKDWRDAGNIVSMVREAGFRNTVQVENLDVPMKQTEEGLRMFLCAFIKSSNPLARSIFGGLLEETVDKGIEMILKGVEAQYGGWPVTLMGEALVVWAVK